MEREQQRQERANRIIDAIAVELDLSFKDLTDCVARQVYDIAIRIEQIIKPKK